MTDKRRPVVSQMVAKRTQAPVQKSPLAPAPAAVSRQRQLQLQTVNNRAMGPPTIPFKVTVNISAAGLRPLAVPNGLPKTPRTLPQDGKVVDVVDLDDDDDEVAPLASPSTFPANQQFRLVPSNQLQQQSLPRGLTYTVVSSGPTMNPGLNRVVIARPQQSPAGQLIVSRNGIANGAAGRQAQVN